MDWAALAAGVIAHSAMLASASWVGESFISRPFKISDYMEGLEQRGAQPEVPVLLVYVRGLCGPAGALGTELALP